VREGGREGGRERGREGEREGEREGGREIHFIRQMAKKIRFITCVLFAAIVTFYFGLHKRDAKEGVAGW